MILPRNDFALSSSGKMIGGQNHGDFSSGKPIRPSRLDSRSMPQNPRPSKLRAIMFISPLCES
jgi:hypothetical protein